MDNDLAALEQRLSTLLAHTRSLRVANETLRNELAQMQARNRELALRVQQATVRLDALLGRLLPPRAFGGVSFVARRRA